MPAALCFDDYCCRIVHFAIAPYDGIDTNICLLPTANLDLPVHNNAALSQIIVQMAFDVKGM